MEKNKLFTTMLIVAFVSILVDMIAKTVILEKIKDEIKKLNSQIVIIMEENRKLKEEINRLKGDLQNKGKIHTIAQVIACESGSNYIQLELVSSVIYNRATDKTLDGLYEVISAKNQFSCFSKLSLSNINEKTVKIATQIVLKMLNGEFWPITDATHFYNPKAVKKTPQFAKKLPLKLAFEDHLYH